MIIHQLTKLYCEVDIFAITILAYKIENKRIFTV